MSAPRPARQPRRATCQDVLDAPAHLVAEIIVPDLAGWRRERLSN